MRDWEPPLRALLLLVLMIRPGDGNEGSGTGRCNCHRKFSSTPTSAQLIYIRKHLKVYSRCQGYIRFQLQKSVCGGSQDRWVLDLVNCFDRKECGHDRGKSVHHLLPPSTRIPELTEGAPPDSSSPAEMQSSQQPTLTSGVLSLDKELTHTLLRETTTFIPGHSLEAGPEAGANEQQKEEKQEEKKPGAAVGTSALVAVLSLLAIVFLLTSVLVYVLCRRRKQPPQNSPDLQFYYTPMSQDSNT